jgi:hypothetical protein
MHIIILICLILDIPLLKFTPLEVKYEPWRVVPLKWIFSYNSYLTDYDSLIKVAVLSAISKTTLIPVCLFYGPVNHMYRWLLKYKVIVIQHRPKWVDLIMSNSAAFKVFVIIMIYVLLWFIHYYDLCIIIMCSRLL